MPYDYKTVLRNNIEELMTAAGITSQAELARRADIDQKTVSNILSKAREADVSSRTVAKLADFFQVSFFKLYTPALDAETLQDKRIEHVLGGYAVATEQGRQTILRVTETEFFYAIKQ